MSDHSCFRFFFTVQYAIQKLGLRILHCIILIILFNSRRMDSFGEWTLCHEKKSWSIACFAKYCKPDCGCGSLWKLHLSLLLAARDLSLEEMSVPQRQKFHTDDIKFVRIWSGPQIGWPSTYIILAIVYEWHTKDKRSNVNAMIESITKQSTFVEFILL